MQGRNRRGSKYPQSKAEGNDCPKVAKRKSYEPQRKGVLKEGHVKSSQERGLCEYGSQKSAGLRVWVPGFGSQLMLATIY